VWQSLERVHHLSSLGQLGSALSTVLDVRLQRCEAESGLTVEELVDFVGK
jgi:hypothetical protein